MNASFPELAADLSQLQCKSIMNSKQPAAIAAGATETIELDRAGVCSGLELHGLYSYVVGTGGTLRPENPFSLIRRIRVLVGTDECLMDLSGAQAYILAQIHRGRQRTLMYDRAPATTTAVTNGRFIIPLDFMFAHLVPNWNGYLPTTLFTRWALEITYAASLTDAIGFGMGGAPSVTGSVQIKQNLVDSPVVAPTGYGGRVIRPFPKSITTSQDYSIKLQTGAVGRYAGILFESRDSANAALTDSTGVTGNIRIVKNSTETRFNIPQAFLKQLMLQRFPENYPGTSTRFDPVGFRYLDMSALYDGALSVINGLSRTLDLTDATEAEIVFGATTGTSVNVVAIPEQFRGVRANAQSLGLVAV